MDPHRYTVRISKTKSMVLLMIWAPELSMHSSPGEGGIPEMLITGGRNKEKDSM